MNQPEPFAVMIAKEAAALAALVVFILAILVWAGAIETAPTETNCPPYWQRNGKPENNAPTCKVCFP